MTLCLPEPRSPGWCYRSGLFCCPVRMFFNNADCVIEGAVFLTTVLTDPAVRPHKGACPELFFRHCEPAQRARND